MENTMENQGTDSIKQAIAAANITEKADTPEPNKKVDEYIKLADSEFMRYLREGNYPEILNAIADHNQFTLRNIMLILNQFPEAAEVAGMKVWNYHKRSIIPGQKALKIIAPLIDESGENSNIRGYELKSVFDISQTTGEDFKKTRLTKDIIENHFERIQAVIQNFADSFNFVENEKSNFVDYENKTVNIKAGLSKEDTLKAMIYSVALIAAEGRDKESGRAISQGKAMFNRIEATGIGYVVSKRLNLGDFKFKSLDFTNSDDESLMKFENNMNRVRALSQRIICAVELQAAEIKEESTVKNTKEQVFKSDPSKEEILQASGFEMDDIL